MSIPAAHAIANCAEALATEGTLGIGSRLEEYRASREAVADLVGAKPADVSMMQTCAAAISQVALGLKLHKGDEILRFDQEYPSNAYPWHEAARRSDARVRIIESETDYRLSTEKLAEAISEQTRVVAVSWVQYSTGSVADLKLLSARCKDVGALLVVDAIQGLGVIPFDMNVLGVDVVCGGTHKWLCGPLGHGFLVMRESLRIQIEPLLHGAITYGTPDDHVTPGKAARTDASRFEPGTPLLLGALGGAAAIRHLLKTGVQEIHDEALRLADRLIETVESLGGECLSEIKGRGESPRSPIVTFRPPGDVNKLCARFEASHVAFAQRGGGIRLSPHAFNTDTEIDAIGALLSEHVSSLD